MFRFVFISLLLSLSVLISPVRTQTQLPVTFNEIMFRPIESNSEFIELFNYSYQDTVDLTGYSIKYQTSNQDYLDSADTYLLLPRRYCLIFEGDYDLVSGIYHNIIPDSVLILKIKDNAFGSSGMSNSSDRRLYLFDSSNVIVDSVTYTANNPAGISDEKIIPESGNDYSNWGNSQIINGTPGFKNSVTPFKHDAAIDSLKTVTINPKVGSTTIFNAKLYNAGLDVIRNITVSFYASTNKDSLCNESNLFQQSTIDSIKPYDSTLIYAEHIFNSPNTHAICAIVNSNEDSNPLNDTSFTYVYVAPKPNEYGDILINEFMYLPVNDEPEWIELYNNTADSINIKGWMIRDKTSHVILTKDTVMIPPSSYLVVSGDSLNSFYTKPFANLIKNIPSLNNKGDKIALVDSLGETIDSVIYSSTWGDLPGTSLERISTNSATNDSTNWKNSVAEEGATPGYYNSVSPHNYDLALQTFNLNTPYVIYGEDAEINIGIINKGISPSYQAILKIYYDYNSNGTGEQDELFKQILLPDLNPDEKFETTAKLANIPLGEGVLIAEIYYPSDEFPDNNVVPLYIDCVQINVYRNDIVINEIMYAPESDEPEWIELFNKSSRQINLNHFLISDLKDTARIDTNVFNLNPGEYLLISKSKSVKDKYKLNGKIIYTQFPLLNNDEDNLLLMDSLKRVVDSLKYFSRWGEKAHSLERVNVYSPSIDSLNWQASRDEQKATPLKINSVSQKLYDVKIDTAFYTPQFPYLNDDIDLEVHIINAGRKRISPHIDIFAAPNDSSNLSLYLSSDSVSVDSGKAYAFRFSKLFKELKSPLMIKLKAVCYQDQDTSNDNYSLNITPSYPNNKISINEFMVYPSGDEPEWIELKNTSTDSINLFNWSISDVITTPKSVKLFNQNVYLEPGEYLVIAKDSTIWEYHKSIPSKVVILQFANMNNDEDGIVIKDANGITNDSLFYNSNWDIQKGVSLEKIDSRFPSNAQDNWGLSEDIEQGTPGRINSIAHKSKDVVISEIFSSPFYPAKNQSVNFNIKLDNKGFQTINNIYVKVFINNSDSLQLFDSLFVNSIATYDSVIIKTNNIYVISDSVRITASVSSKEDEDPYNNYFNTTLYAGYTKGMVQINELMISPKSGEPDWIEFKNVSNQIINLKNCTITDFISSPKTTTITTADYLIQPDSFFIVSNDTLSESCSNVFIVAFGSLSNYEDEITINDFRGATLDSIKYSNDFTIESERSIERFSKDLPTNDFTNWYPSVNVNGATPCKENSIKYLNEYASKSIIINEIMYEPQSSSCDFVEIYNRSSENIDLAGWYIYKNDSIPVEVMPHHLQLKPNSYFIIAEDSSLYPFYGIDTNDVNIRVTNFNLPNSPCSLRLTDFYGNTIDSVKYFINWHAPYFNITKGKSLERINPEINSNDENNWSTSVNTLGATPLKRNSIYTKDKKQHSRLTISNNPFSPDGDGFEDFTIISYSLSSATALIRMRLFDDHGRLVRTIVNNEPSAGEGQIIFDGLGDNGKPLRIGMYILLLEALDENGANLQALKTVLVIATKLD